MRTLKRSIYPHVPDVVSQATTLLARGASGRITVVQLNYASPSVSNVYRATSKESIYVSAVASTMCTVIIWERWHFAGRFVALGPNGRWFITRFTCETALPTERCWQRLSTFRRAVDGQVHLHMYTTNLDTLSEDAKSFSDQPRENLVIIRNPILPTFYLRKCRWRYFPK